jgi:hypothetical protein
VTQRVEVGGELPDDEHRAGAQDRVAGEARGLGEEREVVGRVAGRGEDPQRAEALAVAQHDVDLAAGGADGRARGGGDRGHRLDVVGVVVCQRDAAGAAAPLGLRDDRLDMRIEAGPGVDDPARIAADQPGVRPGQRERAGVVGADERDVVLAERAHWARRYTGPVSDRT